MRYSDFGKFLFETGLRGAMEETLSDAPSVVFVDYCRVADKYDFLDELARELAPTKLHVIDGKLPDDDVVRSNAARFIRPPANIYYRETWQPAPIDRQEIASGFPDLDAMVEGFARLNRNYFKTVDQAIVRDCVETAFFFTLASFRMLAPRTAIIWNAFHPLSRAAALAAKICDIPVYYAEYGLLPGTVSIDARGQMGESSLCTDPEPFNRLPVTETDLNNASRTLTYLYDTGLNRRQQANPKAVASKIEAAAKGRPKVLFAGHNDFASGMIPYDDTARRCHSPFFASSDEAGKHMSEIAAEEDWLLVVKPHPFNLGSNTVTDGANSLVLGDENINACIDACDVVVTVLSQVSYVAMIREKPVVMIGRNQIVQSGAVYSAGSVHAIPSAVSTALKEGVTEEKRLRWHEHVARLVSSYLVRWSARTPREVSALPVSRAALAIGNAVSSGTAEEIYRMTNAKAEDAPRRSA